MQAQEMLKSVQQQQQQQTSPHRLLTISTSSTDDVTTKGPSSQPGSKMTSPPPPPTSVPRSSRGGLSSQQLQTRTSSSSSLNYATVGGDEIGANRTAVKDSFPTAVVSGDSEVEQLREENELLVIKVNKLKYDLKLRDTTVDDLKVCLFV